MLVHGIDAAFNTAYEAGNLAELKKAWGDLYKDVG
jgi:hypothetical protein